MSSLEKPNVITVPEGIRYLSQWDKFSIPDFRCIIDKQITGCGFTEFCLTNSENVILCSPRKILLENKEKQHNWMPDPNDPDNLIRNPNPEFPVYYAENLYEKDKKTDPNLANSSKPKKGDPDEATEEITEEEIKNIKKGIEDYFYKCFNRGIPCKILVTYDSFKYVKEVFTLLHQMENFKVVADEFQAIIQDAKFKSSTEIKFLDNLANIEKLCFVSATPILGAYLKMLPEFKDLPYYVLDWETAEKERVIEPLIDPHYCPRGIIQPACEVVRDYKSGNFKKTVVNYGGKLIEVESREAVLYVNCVNNICEIVSKTGLTLDECNILCADTEENKKKLRKAFGIKNTKIQVIGKVPLKGRQHKMFTFCTRTAYIGADFYSPCARNFIFSDANIDCLTVDIQIDLPQILGRQRLEYNPWRNKAVLFFRLRAKAESMEHGEEILERKTRATIKLMELYEAADPEGKIELIRKFKKDHSNYRDDYVAINEDANGNPILVFNNLVKVILQKNYKDLFKLFNSLEGIENRDNVEKILKELAGIQYFHNKMKFLYELDMPDEIARVVLNNVEDTDFGKYYWTISRERAKALKYQKGNLEAEYNNTSGTVSVVDVIYDTFEVGQKYSKSDVKQTLKEIYHTCCISKTAKATDLEDYFVIKDCLVQNKETGKRDRGFEIVKARD